MAERRRNAALALLVEPSTNPELPDDGLHAHGALFQPPALEVRGERHGVGRLLFALHVVSSRACERVRCAIADPGPGLPSVARIEQIKRFAILEEELTQDEGELTPTLKVKRAAVAARFAHRIAALYAG